MKIDIEVGSVRKELAETFRLLADEIDSGKHQAISVEKEVYEILSDDESSSLVPLKVSYVITLKYVVTG